MGKLRVTSVSGDRIVEWDPVRAETGDPESLAAVREAERVLEEQLRQGAAAFRVVAGAPAERLSRFDPRADQIVTVPRVMGG